MTDNNKSGLVYHLAQIILRIKSSALSKKDISIVRQHLLDSIASAFIGCRSDVFAELLKTYSSMGDECVWLGSGRDRASSIDAGMLWAFAINASVFEDGSREGACHPAAAVMSTAIALSQGKSWDRIDTAIVAGYDIMARLARSGNPEFTRRGFHPTSITAPFGVAVTAAVLLGYDLPKIQNALCISALGSTGLMASFKSGATQPFQVALAVRSGIMAAMLAGAGHSGYDRIIEEGFFPAFLGNDPVPPIIHPLEQKYAILGSYLKPYPGCRHVHPAIDAFEKVLRQQDSISPSDIREIKVKTYKIAVETEIHDLKTRGDAYFNIPYALAARVVLGKINYESFDEKHFNNELIREVIKKTTVYADFELDRLYPRQRSAIIIVCLNDGRTLVGEISHPLGEPENPLPISATKDKFHDAAGDILTAKKRLSGSLTHLMG